MNISITLPDDSANGFIDVLCGDPEGTHCGDLLLRSFSGWWLFGLLHRPGYWLVCDAERMTGAVFDEAMQDAEALMDKAQRGESLPENVYLMDRAAAIRALTYGVERWGVEGFLGGRGDEDCAVQHALLGRVLYG